MTSITTHVRNYMPFKRQVSESILITNRQKPKSFRCNYIVQYTSRVHTDVENNYGFVMIIIILLRAAGKSKHSHSTLHF